MRQSFLSLSLFIAVAIALPAAAAAPPITARDAARRALVLAAVVQRAAVESRLTTLTDTERSRVMKTGHEIAFGVLKWIVAEQLHGAVSVEEKRLLQKPFGTWTKQERADGIWRGEALTAIAWALRLVEKLPAYDTLANFEDLILSLPIAHRTTAFVDKARLRSAAEITRARDQAELEHKRARATKRPDGTWSMETSIARERQYGLGWLCGQSTNWDAVPTEPLGDET